MNILIAGGWKKADFLLRSLSEKNHSVTLVHDDTLFCKKLSRKYDALIINGDPSKPYILEDADIEEVDMLIALTPEDEKNLVICQLSKKIYGVDRVFSIVSNPKNVEIFKELGIDMVISATHVITNVIEQIITIDEISQIAPIEEGKIAIMEISINEKSPACNKTLMDINLSEGATIGCIIRGSSTIIPKGNTKVLENDKLIILVLLDYRDIIIREVTGK